MKKILIATGLLIASVAHAESLSEPIDMTKLSAYEQMVHRLAWCKQMGRAMREGKVPEYPYETSDRVYEILFSRGFFEKDWDDNRVEFKAMRDLEAEIILGKKFSNREAAKCNNDARAILKKEYVPNFTYIEK